MIARNRRLGAVYVEKRGRDISQIMSEPLSQQNDSSALTHNVDKNKSKSKSIPNGKLLPPDTSIMKYQLYYNLSATYIY